MDWLRRWHNVALEDTEAWAEYYAERKEKRLAALDIAPPANEDEDAVRDELIHKDWLCFTEKDADFERIMALYEKDAKLPEAQMELSERELQLSWSYCQSRNRAFVWKRLDLSFCKFPYDEASDPLLHDERPTFETFAEETRCVTLILLFWGVCLVRFMLSVLQPFLLRRHASTRGGRSWACLQTFACATCAALMLSSGLPLWLYCCSPCLHRWIQPGPQLSLHVADSNILACNVLTIALFNCHAHTTLLHGTLPPQTRQSFDASCEDPCITAPPWRTR